jgi:5-methylcytosine-specific restriction protein A
MARAPSLCIEPGCDELVDSGRCPSCEVVHRKARAQRRGPQRDTDLSADRTWRKVRGHYLKRHPNCERDGCSDPATDVHHKRDRADGGSHKDDNLEALCHSHHSSTTATRQARLLPRT